MKAVRRAGRLTTAVIIRPLCDSFRMWFSCSPHVQARREWRRDRHRCRSGGVRWGGSRRCDRPGRRVARACREGDFHGKVVGFRLPLRPSNFRTSLFRARTWHLEKVNDSACGKAPPGVVRSAGRHEEASSIAQLTACAILILHTPVAGAPRQRAR